MTTELTRRWYKADDPATELWATVQRLRNRQSWRQQSDELALRLYCDMRIVGYRSQAAGYQIADVLDERLGDNTIRPIIRTLHSKAVRHRPTPFVITEGASWSLKNRADNLQRWLRGKLEEQRWDDHLYPLATLQGLILGTACIRTGYDEDGSWAEAVPVYEILIDDSEARYGDLRNIYLVRVADRDVLTAHYPKRADVVEKASQGLAGVRGWVDGLGAWDQDQDANLVITVEAFHLPSSKNAKDGRRVICVDSGWLADETWEKSHLPMAFWRPERRPLGFWGIGTPEDLAGAQLEVNRVAVAVQEMVELMAVPFWTIERGARIVKSHISNLIGRIVEYTGTPPQLVTPNAVPPDLWQHKDRLKRGMFETRGISQLSAQMLKPAGLNSGKALRTYNDFENELLIDMLQACDRFVLDVCTLLIEAQRDCAEHYGDQAVTVLGDGAIQRIKWSDADMETEKFRLRILPASALSTSYSSRLQDVSDLRDLGAIQDPDEIRDLLNMPDLQRQEHRALAPRQLLERIIEEKILKDGVYVQPEPTWDLALAFKLGLQYIASVELYEDAPADKLEILRTWTAMCQKMIEDSTAPPTPAPSAPGASPGPPPPAMPLPPLPGNGAVPAPPPATEAT